LEEQAGVQYRVVVLWEMLKDLLDNVRE